MRKTDAAKLCVAVFVASAIVLSPAASQTGQYSADMLTLPTGSLAHGIGVALAGTISRRSPVTMLVAPQAGQQVVIPLLQRGEGAFTLINNFDVLQAYRGQKPQYQEPNRRIRIASIGYENRVSLLTTQKSGIRGRDDVIGKRVAGTFTAHQTCLDLANAFMANFGIKWGDVRTVPAQTAVTSVQALGEGRIDVSTCAAVGMAAIKELNVRQPLRFLSVDPSPEAMARAREHFPGVRPLMIKGGSTEGAAEDVNIFSFDFYLATHAGVPDQIVYEVLKAVWENLAELREINPVFRTWSLERMASAEATVPYHPGAIKFFREKGVWTAEMDRATQSLLN